LLSATASAQQMQLDAFRPAIDSRGYLTLNGSQVLDHTDLSFGLGSLEWGRHLLAMPNGSSIDNMVSATLVAAIGLRAGVPFELGASLPFTIMNGNGAPNMARLDEQGIGNLGFHLKARLAHAGPLGVAAIGSLYLPTANQPFLGEPKATPQLIGVVDLTFERWRIGANGGVRLRSTQTYSDPMMMGNVTTSTELPVGLAAAYALAPEKVELVGEVFGAIPIGEHRGYQPLEALGGLKVYLGKNSYLSIGAGRGLVPSQAGNPDLRATIGIVFEPKPAQRAAAHIEDETVAYVPPPKHDEEPPDRDGDGVPDKDDKCPDEAGPAWNDGCPDTFAETKVDSEFVPLEPIEFEFDKAVIRPSSFPIVDGIAKSLLDHPELALVEVQGHTDEQGPDAYNMDLSNRRAAAVMQYLVEHGVPASRLTSKGYGKHVPLVKEHNAAAWKKNRRVAFVIKEKHL
jgi:outer membrane protein OmpA-like peptidoglycan-associated protein